MSKHSGCSLPPVPAGTLGGEVSQLSVVTEEFWLVLWGCSGYKWLENWGTNRGQPDNTGLPKKWLCIQFMCV